MVKAAYDLCHMFGDTARTSQIDEIWGKLSKLKEEISWSQHSLKTRLTHILEHIAKNRVKVNETEKMDLQERRYDNAKIRQSRMSPEVQLSNLLTQLEKFASSEQYSLQQYMESNNPTSPHTARPQLNSICNGEKELLTLDTNDSEQDKLDSSAKIPNIDQIA